MGKNAKRRRERRQVRVPPEYTADQLMALTGVAESFPPSRWPQARQWLEGLDEVAPTDIPERATARVLALMAHAEGVGANVEASQEELTVLLALLMEGVRLGRLAELYELLYADVVKA